MADLPNIRVKLGGLAMAVSGFSFHQDVAPPTSPGLAAAWQPPLDAAIDLFGPARRMFESNFPVDKGTVTYGSVWNAFKRLAARHSDEEQEALFSGTARATYRMATLSAPDVC